MNWDDLTEKTKKRFDNRKKMRMKCTNCGNEIYGKEIWQDYIKPTIDIHEVNEGSHLLNQIRNGKDLFYIACQGCGEGEYVPKAR